MIAWLRRLLGLEPSLQDVVKAVIAGTASLELKKDESRKLKPLEGMFGPILIEGNALPAFTYMVFDKQIMDFVTVTARLSLPDKILFESKTPDWGHIATLKPYKDPFMQLCKHLYAYFPLLPEGREPPREI